MYLADSSLWIEHFKKKNSPLIPLLTEGKVITHDFILGELSLGHFRKSEHSVIFERLHFLEKIPTSSHEEVFDFSMANRLAGQGIGWVDCHLLHACLQNKAQLVTLDKKLEKVFRKISG